VCSLSGQVSQAPLYLFFYSGTENPLNLCIVMCRGQALLLHIMDIDIIYYSLINIQSIIRFTSVFKRVKLPLFLLILNHWLKTFYLELSKHYKLMVALNFFQSALISSNLILFFLFIYLSAKWVSWKAPLSSGRIRISFYISCTFTTIVMPWGVWKHYLCHKLYTFFLYSISNTLLSSSSQGTWL
jgi:hypothetical protein